MKENKIIWFDFTNVPHVNFFKPIIDHFNNTEHIYSIRDFAETKGLFEKIIGKEYFLVGSHKGQNKIKKIASSVIRINSLQHTIPKFDVKMSVGGDASSIVAKLRGKMSITFDDNEKAPNWRYSQFSDLAFWPNVINKELLHRQGFKENKLHQYNGFKEDLYLADFLPDENFINDLPFKNYVVVRPENIQANYVKTSSSSIVPSLLKKLDKQGVNVIFLPRYKHDISFAKDFNNVFIPNTAINGLDACYYADAVFTGAGTMAREAACLGVPAYSFYTGKKLLTVDQKMIEKGWLFFSRDPSEHMKHFLSTEKRMSDLSRSKDVKKQILQKLDEYLSS